MSQGSEILKRGRRLMGKAIRITAIEGPTDEAHQSIRSAIQSLRSAMNWLEDSPEFEDAHDLLDQAGRIARATFPSGCHLEFRDNTYYQECAAALAHNRVGLSPGMIIVSAECSICGRDPEDCDHVKGRVYEGETCRRIIREAEVLEFSLVARPAQPDARIESISVETRELRERLGPAFRPGMPVLCDKCLTPCGGVVRPFEGKCLYLN